MSQESFFFFFQYDSHKLTPLPHCKKQRQREQNNPKLFEK